MAEDSGVKAMKKTFLGILMLGGVLALRHHRRCRRAEPAPRRRARGSTGDRRAAEVARAIHDSLGAVRGYCELAKMKGESGDDLARRMDAAIATVSEASALIQQLLARSRRRAFETDPLL